MFFIMTPHVSLSLTVSFPPLPTHTPSLLSGKTTETKSMAVTGDVSDESPWLQRLSLCSAEKWKNQRKKGFSWRGMEGAEEGAEVEMWTEVLECRPRGSEPLIDCSGLTEALCDCHFQHTQFVFLPLWGPSVTLTLSNLKGIYNQFSTSSAWLLCEVCANE